MTATTLSRLPLLAGGAVAASLGRAGQWTLAQYMRAPLASTGLLALVTLTAMAASNALYMQSERHPAPFFAPVAPMAETMAEIAVAPEPLPALARPAVPALVETTGSVAAPVGAAVVPDAPVGNRDAFAVQKKLSELGIFNGKVDGFYGPMTANAIRTFETRNGMPSTGALTPGVIDAILRADATGAAPQAAAAPVAQPVPVTAPAPVVAQPVVQQVPAQQADRVVARLPNLSPVDQAVDTIGNAAANTIDSIVAAVDGARGTASAPAQTMPVPTQVVSTPAPAPVATASVAPANNVQLVSTIQRGLASLGFYRGSIDGHPGDATARAIREFENFHSYRVTGQIKPDLVGLLRQAGADI
ncbi:peptidoglycan-binding domain-containing protein [Devosia sp.]|uniref:peptidoglycan-binding domain-containing protein n=1 Tax=Devosia sp. TaxID=1871048 RepID=UPI002AFEFC98|nr:peptidoglycan-binding domain-containing protein [Devosia sp.]